jgi:hypothetical protein
VCTPNSTSSTGCTITNGSGQKTRTCSSDGSSWGSYGSCQVTSCSSGYHLSGNTCVEDEVTNTYDFYLRNESLSKTTVQAGETITASVSSYYSGNVLDDNMGGVKVGYYLSTNNTLGSTDTRLDSDTSYLGSDDIYDNESESITIPSSLSAGTYYILFVTDYDNQYNEINENNNIEYISISVTSSQVCTPNSTSTTSCTVTNGTGQKTRACSSDGSSWGNYGSCQVTSCNSGYHQSGNSCIKDEVVNTYDFYLQSESLSKTSMKSGDTITASVRAYYSGNVLNNSMGNVRTGYYLSTNNTLSSNDMLVGFSYSSLGSDDSYDSENVTFNIPTSLPTGTYYILFVADEDKKFSETNENNNIEYIQINVTQHPIVNSLSPSSPKVQSSGVRTTAYIQGNNFQGNASVRMCYYPSPNTQCSTLVVGYSSNWSYAEVIDSNVIKIYFLPGTTPTEWSVTVTNPDGKVSNIHSFNTSY